MIDLFETRIRMLKKPKLKNPILIEGLPGLGLVGKLAADHMVKSFSARHFADMYSPHFPPQANILPDGTVELPHDSFYYWKNRSKSKRSSDLIFLVGDYQSTTPFGHYELASEVIRFARKLGVKTVITLGGYGVGYMSKNPRVFAAVSDAKTKKQIELAGASFDKTGGIVGAAGLLIGLAGLNKMRAICLMGETHGQIIDARSAKSVLDVLTKLLRLEIDTTELEKRAEDIDKELKKQQKRVESPAPQEGFNPQYIR